MTLKIENFKKLYCHGYDCLQMLGPQEGKPFSAQAESELF
jgi:hypothetical protein